MFSFNVVRLPHVNVFAGESVRHRLASSCSLRYVSDGKAIWNSKIHFAMFITENAN